LDDLPLRIEEIARVSGARRLVCEASCWRGVLLLTGGTRASRRGGNKAAVTLHGGTKRMDQAEGPWRAATPSSRRTTLSVSPEDDLRPPTSKTLSVSPCEGENLFPEGGRNPSPCVSPLPRGEQEGSSPSEGSCGAGILRLPHRSTDPRGEGEHHSPAGLPHNPSGTHKHRKAKTDEDR